MMVRAKDPAGMPKALMAGVATVMLVVGVVGARVLHDERSFAANDPPKGVSASAPPRFVPPTTDEVVEAVKVETGLTAGNVYACDSAGGRATGWYPGGRHCPPEQWVSIGDTVSYGIVLENTSDVVLVGIPITYQFLDAAGRVVAEPKTAFSDDDLMTEEGTIDALRPGERFGFGGMRYRDRPGTTRMKVTVGKPQRWMTPAEAQAELGPLGAHNPVAVTSRGLRSGEQKEPIVSYTADSESTQPINSGYVYAILRDTSGHIVGGVFGWVRKDIPPGKSVDDEIALDDPMEVPGIDPDTIDLYFSPYAV